MTAAADDRVRWFDTLKMSSLSVHWSVLSSELMRVAEFLLPSLAAGLRCRRSWRGSQKTSATAVHSGHVPDYKQLKSKSLLTPLLKSHRWIDLQPPCTGCKYEGMIEPIYPCGPVSAIRCVNGDWSTLKAALLATRLIDLESLQFLSGQDYILMFRVCIKDLRRPGKRKKKNTKQQPWSKTSVQRMHKDTPNKLLKSQTWKQIAVHWRS